MPLSMTELANAREITKPLLDDLWLDAYLYEVEPDGEELEIKIECALDEGWETVKFTAEKALLLHALDDPDAHQTLLAQWRKELSTCLPKS